MKKIHFLLVFVIIFGFVWNNKAIGQSCDKCSPNTICIPLTFDVGECEDIRVTPCVRCGVTNPSIYWLGVMYENISPGFEAQIQQYLDNWIRDYTLQICVGCHTNRILWDLKNCDSDCQD